MAAWQIICSRLQEIISDPFEDVSSISEGCIDYQVQVRLRATKRDFVFELL